LKSSENSAFLKTLSHHAEVIEEAAFSIGASTLDWFKRTMNIQDDPEVTSSESIFIFPGLCRNLFPSWADDGPSSIVGLRQHHGSGNILAAAYECIAFEICSSLSCLEGQNLILDGGLSNRDLLVSLIAACLGTTIFRQKVAAENTAYGAALLDSGIPAEEPSFDIIAPEPNEELLVKFKTWQRLKKILSGILQ
jgi:sugar (pentulose or hexulose) kinase